ncbi:MAG TPA: NUDIX hydrolase [Roseiflexaceae bacterium]
MFSRRRRPQPWRTRSSAVVYNQRILVIEDLVSTPSNGEFVYPYVKSAHDAIATLTMTDDGQVVLARAYCHPMRKILYTLLTGSMLDGEVPSQAARRVLADAAGLLAHQLTPLGRMAPFPDTVAGTIHLFLARKLAPAPDQRDTPEPGEVVLMDAIEALQRTLRGEFADGALQLALLFAAQQQLF